MKRLLLLINFIFCILHSTFSQNPLVKQWDKRFGGTFNDNLYSIQETNDGAYILGGQASSNIGGDKSQISQGYFDYWIIKIDTLGNKQWDKDFGGTNNDVLTVLQQTSDLGYILGGYSASGISGDKTQNTWGNWDYWIVKIDSLGNKQWDKDFGGIEADYLYSINQTVDDGYILGGYSASGISGNKTQNTWGYYDYWIIKIDSLGIKQWDKDFGGIENDYLYSIQQSFDGGYILGGTSWSDTSGNKTQSNWDTSANYNYRGDYWIVKTDSLGNKQWDKDFGGTSNEYLNSLLQINDGYILGGSSGSDSSGNKTEPMLDTNAVEDSPGDLWIVKIDFNGNKVWDKKYGGLNLEHDFGNISQTADGGYLFAGTSYSNISGDKSENNLGFEQSWVVKTDSLGNKQWDKTLHTACDTSDHDEYAFAIQTKNGCYLMGNWTSAGIGGDKTQSNWGICNPLCPYDYWIIKFCDSTLTTNIQSAITNPQSAISIYPNPANESLVISDKRTGKKEIEIYDLFGRIVLKSALVPGQSSMVNGQPSITIDISKLSPGIYFIKAGNAVRKLVKE